MSEPIPQVVREYMSALGSKRTATKTQSSRLNVAKAREARRRDPLTVTCTCQGGASLDASAHKTTCPRGRLLQQRVRQAQKKAAQAEVGEKT